MLNREARTSRRALPRHWTDAWGEHARKEAFEDHEGGRGDLDEARYRNKREWTLGRWEIDEGVVVVVGGLSCQALTSG